MPGRDAYLDGLPGNVPAAIPLVMEKIQAGLGAVNPIAVGMTLKRLTNIRSDFVAAVKASGVIPITLNVKAQFDPEWVALFPSCWPKDPSRIVALGPLRQRSRNRTRRNKRRCDQWFYRSGT